MIKKTFFSKCNTIIKDTVTNLGFNPIIELYYGKMISRGLLYFDHTDLKKMHEEKVFPDLNKLKHRIRLTNSSMIRVDDFVKKYLDITRKDERKRAVSFDLVLFLIPSDWDNGCGFDFTEDMFLGHTAGYSKDGSNWFYRNNYNLWSCKFKKNVCDDYEYAELFDENGFGPGVLSNDRLYEEIEKYKNGEDSLIVGAQHFDFGSESVNIDITDIVNKFITGEKVNNGLCLAFSPVYEDIETNENFYVGFFSNKTNTFFEPYIESVYDDFINDDRCSFYLNKNNRLFFYSIINGCYENLDDMPTCEINGVGYEVKQLTKGVYYIDINLSSKEIEPETMLYDTWGNIKYDGVALDDVVMRFTTISADKFYSFGIQGVKNEERSVKPCIKGISNGERLTNDEIRKISILNKYAYSVEVAKPTSKMRYKMRIKQGNVDVDVFDWQPVNRCYLENCFYINTKEMVPTEYFVDIEITEKNEKRIFKDIVSFTVNENRTEVYY